MDVPQRLLERLDALGAVLAARGDAIALLGLGSVGRDVERLDEHSDLDFFVIVEDDAKPRYLRSIDWLEELHPIAFDFENTVDGRKVLFADRLYAEYAIFTLGELRAASYPPARVIWQRADAPEGLDHGHVPNPSPTENADFQVNEALTNLYVGLHRELRGERLAATRLIQVHAVDRLLTFVELSAATIRPRQDLYAIERGAEKRFGPELVPLSSFVPGYEHNAEAAVAILGWFQVHATVDGRLAAEIRDLADRCSQRGLTRRN